MSLRGCLLRDLFVRFSRPPGSQEEENFTCRLGEIQVRRPRGLVGTVLVQRRLGAHWFPLLAPRGTGGGSGDLGAGCPQPGPSGWAEPPLFCQVVDANSLLTPLPQVQAVTVSHVRWRPATSDGEGGRAGLQLSCTLHWAYLLPRVRGFRIHCCRGTGGGAPGGGPSEPEKPTLLGLAFVNRYRIVDLVVAAAEPGRDGRVEFLVEPVPKEGFLVPRAQWGRAAMLYSTPRT